MGSNFFSELVNKKLIDEWAKNIDWLLNDKKFDRWETQDKKSYTKLLKKYLNDNKIDYSVYKIGELCDLKIKKKLYVYINSGESESLDIVRHIRNGIAHGNCNLKKISIDKDKIMVIEITDYSKSGKVSAKIRIPIDSIGKIRALYKNVIKMKKR